MSHFCNQRKILFSKDNHTFCGNGFWFWMVRIIIFGGHGFRFLDFWEIESWFHLAMDSNFLTFEKLNHNFWQWILMGEKYNYNFFWFLRNRIIISSRILASNGFWWVSAAVHYLATRFPNPFLCQPRYYGRSTYIHIWDTAHNEMGTIWMGTCWLGMIWLFSTLDKRQLAIPNPFLCQPSYYGRSTYMCVFWMGHKQHTMKWGLFEWVPVDWVWFDAFQPKMLHMRQLAIVNIQGVFFSLVPP